MNNKNFDTKTKYVKTSLALVGIVVNLETAYLIRTTLEKLEAEGGEFSVGDAANIQIEAEKYFKSLEGEEKVMIKDYLNYVAIHCKTEDEAIKCCYLANLLGLKWWIGGLFTETNNWKHYKECTCYNFLGGSYDHKEHFKNNGYVIRSAQWFLDNFTPKQNKS